MVKLDHELHLHLYGCLSADDIWELGRDRIGPQAERLDWYASEYEKAWGRRPDWKKYWSNQSGLDLLRKDYEFVEGAPFANFQACFNLIIALFPLTPSDATVLRRVMYRDGKSGLKYAEYRTLLPSWFDDATTDQYLTQVATETLACQSSFGGSFVPRLALSLPRDPALLDNSYRRLKSWLQNHKSLAPAIPAVDFCMQEEGWPPKDKKAFLAALQRDNARDPETALAVLYHVGESFYDKTVMSAARWVWEAASMGCHRLGHALAVAVDPEGYIGQTIEENRCEFVDHQRWLLSSTTWLADRGHKVDSIKVRDRLRYGESQSTPTISVSMTRELITEARSLQAAIMRDLAERGIPIESCPTSNLRIGQIVDHKHHPLPRMMDHKLAVTLSTDDPGVFAISLESETDFAVKICGGSSKEIERWQRNAEAFCAARLIGRSTL